MTARIRPSVAALPVYRPGRNPDDVARELGLPRVIKLASNESAFGPLPSVLEAIGVAGPALHRYPDAAAVDLVSALAVLHDRDPAQIAVGAGSVALCQQLILATASLGDEVLFGWRSFEAYPLLVAGIGARAVTVPLAEHCLDLDAMAAAVTEATRLIFLCTPNNPTGTASSVAAVERFCDDVPDDVLVVIDEAYHDFVTDPDAASGPRIARERSNVAVLRTMSKAHGLAGLRVGYLIGAAEVVRAVKAVAPPFSVSTTAQLAALASLRAEEELAPRVAATVAERTRVIERLRAAGYPVPDSQANFCWLPLGADAVTFAAGCERRGVIVRPFDGDGVRVTIGTVEENDVFLAAAAEIRLELPAPS